MRPLGAAQPSGAAGARAAAATAGAATLPTGLRLSPPRPPSPTCRLLAAALRPAAGHRPLQAQRRAAAPREPGVRDRHLHQGGCCLTGCLAVAGCLLSLFKAGCLFPKAGGWRWVLVGCSWQRLPQLPADGAGGRSSTAVQRVGWAAAARAMQRGAVRQPLPPGTCMARRGRGAPAQHGSAAGRHGSGQWRQLGTAASRPSNACSLPRLGGLEAGTPRGSALASCPPPCRSAPRSPSAAAHPAAPPLPLPASFILPPRWTWRAWTPPSLTTPTSRPRRRSRRSRARCGWAGVGAAAAAAAAGAITWRRRAGGTATAAVAPVAMPEHRRLENRAPCRAVRHLPSLPPARLTLPRLPLLSAAAPQEGFFAEKTEKAALPAEYVANQKAVDAALMGKLRWALFSCLRPRRSWWCSEEEGGEGDSGLFEASRGGRCRRRARRQPASSSPSS